MNWVVKSAIEKVTEYFVLHFLKFLRKLFKPTLEKVAFLGLVLYYVMRFKLDEVGIIRINSQTKQNLTTAFILITVVLLLSSLFEKFKDEQKPIIVDGNSLPPIY